MVKTVIIHPVIKMNQDMGPALSVIASGLRGGTGIRSMRSTWEFRSQKGCLDPSMNEGQVSMKRIKWNGKLWVYPNGVVQPVFWPEYEVSFPSERKPRKARKSKPKKIREEERGFFI
jgi:hypothetical protein